MGTPTCLAGSSMQLRSPCWVPTGVQVAWGQEPAHWTHCGISRAPVPGAVCANSPVWKQEGVAQGGHVSWNHSWPLW